jgi:hypothetical protein
MLRSLGEVLSEQAPDLFARTKLRRDSPDYLTQRQAFDLHRQRKLEDLGKKAPDLFARTRLPFGHPERLETNRAYQLLRSRQHQTDD